MLLCALLLAQGGSYPGSEPQSHQGLVRTPLALEWHTPVEVELKGAAPSYYP